MSTRIARPYTLSAADAAAFWQVGILWSPLATGVQTDNALSLIEELCHAGSGPPTHAHSQDEVFYVLEGHCTFNAGGKTVPAPPGTFVAVPRDTPHSFSVDAEPSRVLNFYTPAGFELILMSIAAPAGERTLPAAGQVELPPRWVVEALSRDYGQTKVLGLPFADMPTPESMATTLSEASPYQPFGADAGSAPAYWQADTLWSVLATGAQTAGSYCLLEQLCPEGSGPPPHTHEQDEAVYVLDGELAVVAGDRRFSAGKGAFVFVPRGTAHSFKVTSPTARLLNLFTPSGFERTITELGRPAGERSLPPPGLTTDASTAKTRAVLAQAGLRQVLTPE